LAWAVLMAVRPSRFLLAAGALGNALVVATWILTRTYGTLVGPEASEPAMAGFGDIVTTAFEGAIVNGALAMLRARRLDPPTDSHWGEVANALTAIGITLMTVLALYSTVGGSPFVSPVD